MDACMSCCESDRKELDSFLSTPPVTSVASTTSSAEVITETPVLSVTNTITPNPNPLPQPSANPALIRRVIPVGHAPIPMPIPIPFSLAQLDAMEHALLLRVGRGNQ